MIKINIYNYELKYDIDERRYYIVGMNKDFEPIITDSINVINWKEGWAKTDEIKYILSEVKK